MMEAATIVLFPAPSIGHKISMVELAKHILLHNHFFITILLTTRLLDHPSIDSYIHHISTSHPSISFLSFPSIIVTATTTQRFVATIFPFVKTNVANFKTALHQICQSSTTVKAVIINLLCNSTMEVVSSIEIPVYYFFTSGVAVLALFSYFPKIHRQMKKSFKDMARV